MDYYLTTSASPFPCFQITWLSKQFCTFVSRQAAELSEGLGGSATQQAVVHAFLQDYDRVQYNITFFFGGGGEAITCWSHINRNKFHISAHLCIILYLSFQAIHTLTRATRISPTTNMLILLGKTCMKAKQFENAIASFKRAVYNLVRTSVFCIHCMC